MSGFTPTERLRAICLAFPEAQEQAFGGHTKPTWRVNGKIFALMEEQRDAVWFKAPPGGQAILIDVHPDTFFVPPYMGKNGWVGVRADSPDIDWDELHGLIAESYRLIAPKRLAARM